MMFLFLWDIGCSGVILSRRIDFKDLICTLEGLLPVVEVEMCFLISSKQKGASKPGSQNITAFPHGAFVKLPGWIYAAFIGKTVSRLDVMPGWLRNWCSDLHIL